MLERRRDEVARACHELAAAGLVPTTTGNVSAREGDLVAVTSTGAALATITAADVTVVDLGGAVLAGPPPTSELAMHLAIYARRADAGAVVHTHAPAAVAVSGRGDDVPVDAPDAALLGGAVRVAPRRPSGSAELAAAVVAALAGRSGALMAGHGTVAVGADLAAAQRVTQALERACSAIA